MRTTTRALSAGAAIVLFAACDEPTSTSGLLADGALSGALVTAPEGYGDLTSSFVGGRADMANGDSAGFHGGPRGGRRMGPGVMMGGGMHDAYVGGVAFAGRAGHRGPFGGGLACDGSFDAATGRVECAPRTLRNGLTVTRSASYTDAQGGVQQAFDSLTTDVVNLRASVSGTIAFTPRERPHDGQMTLPPRGRRRPAGPGRHGRPMGGPGMLLGDTARILSATITVSNASDRTVSGLAQASTQRTVNATSGGEERTVGTSTRGDFSVVRTIADTTTGLVIPVRGEGRVHPAAGTVVRRMTATIEVEGLPARTISRREQVTYDGSATARVRITENGVTRNCTRPLPRGPLTCE